MPSIGMGKIFTIGGTAALAWELPHDPYTPFRKPAELLHRRVDKPEQSTSAEWASQQDTHAPSAHKYQKTYYNPFILQDPNRIPYGPILYENRPIQYSAAYRQYVRKKNVPSRRLYHTIKNGYTNSKKYRRPEMYVHPDYHWVHRRTRRDLYSKIEKFFTA